ncbi:TolC family protein [Saccharicrinis sp. FJH62]|uniref:TolC family protein n=1 Tax=Saccharicrinis sp. FJH62 TaxID=3344657 RepID=UPI0035D496EE
MLLKRIFLIFLFVPAALLGQQVTLQQCYSDGYYHHPSYDNMRLLLKIGELENENSGVSNLPQATLKANASWQSDVTSVNLQIPGVTIPKLAQDWYKLYIDVTQTIYDGGLAKSKKAVADAKTEADVQQQEVNLYAVKGNVNLAYFSALNLQNQIKILNLKKQVLQDQSKVVESAVKNGAVNSNEQNNLKAEMVLLNQQIIELESLHKASLDNLSLITGKTFNDKTELVLPANPVADSTSIPVNRPELDLIEAQKEQLDNQSDLLQNTRKPRIYGYGQAGYGRPGLNMFNDNFADWYIVGVGLQWKIYDWKETSRKKEQIELQKEIADNQKESFLYQLDLLTRSKWNEIEKLNRIIATDEELVTLRKDVADNSASQLKNGVIKSADYIRDLNNYFVAQLTNENHQVALLKAKYEYITLTGTEKDNNK